MLFFRNKSISTSIVTFGWYLEAFYAKQISMLRKPDEHWWLKSKVADVAVFSSTSLNFCDDFTLTLVRTNLSALNVYFIAYYLKLRWRERFWLQIWWLTFAQRRALFCSSQSVNLDGYTNEV